MESFIEEALNKSLFLHIKENAPVALLPESGYHQLFESDVQILRHCVDVLFYFETQFSIKKKEENLAGISKKDPTEEYLITTFYHDIREWLKKLVGVVLRTATANDHMYILHHIIRCPNISAWGANFLQFPPQW